MNERDLKRIQRELRKANPSPQADFAELRESRPRQQNTSLAVQRAQQARQRAGRKLERDIASLGLSTDAIAKLAGVSERTVSAIIEGRSVSELLTAKVHLAVKTQCSAGDGGYKPRDTSGTCASCGKPYDRAVIDHEHYFSGALLCPACGAKVGERK